MTELKPCPCCGPKSFITPSTKCDPQAGKHCWTAELRCHECGLNISRTAATEKEALHEVIKAWNTRAERTCQTKPVIGGGWFCSHCGVFVDRHPMANATDRLEARYCPNCGAKVVE